MPGNTQRLKPSFYGACKLPIYYKPLRPSFLRQPGRGGEGLEQSSRPFREGNSYRLNLGLFRHITQPHSRHPRANMRRSNTWYFKIPKALPSLERCTPQPGLASDVANPPPAPRSQSRCNHCIIKSWLQTVIRKLIRSTEYSLRRVNNLLHACIYARPAQDYVAGTNQFGRLAHNLGSAAGRFSPLPSPGSQSPNCWLLRAI